MLKVLFDRVLVERVEAENKTAGGIIIPDTAKEKPIAGFVISVGDKVETLKAGDKILFSKFTGSEVKFDGKDYLIMKEADILAICE